MNWHYEKAGQNVGPITDEEMLSLRTFGGLGADTLVWCEGWPDWRRAGEVWPTPVAVPSAPPIPASLAVGSRCAECGKASAPGDLVPVGGVLVCESCKPIAVQKLQEGVVNNKGGLAAGLGPWQDGRLLVTEKDAALPPHCIKCGEASITTVKKKLYWHSPFIYITILASLLIYIIVAIIVRKNSTHEFPFCSSCNAKRKRNTMISWLLFLTVIAGFALGIATFEPGANFTAYIFTGSSILLFAALVWVIRSTIVKPKRIDERYAWIAKTGRPFLDSLPKWPGS